MAWSLLSSAGMPPSLAKAVSRPDPLAGGPRERLASRGPDALGDGDLLALLIGTGTARESVTVLAAQLLGTHGGLVGLSRSGVAGLADSYGVGHAKAARIAAAVEIGRRVAREEAQGTVARFGDAKGVNAWARPLLACLEHEELWLLALDGRNALRASRRVAMGGLHGLSVAPRDPLRVALREAASAFVLVHNHPSGDPTPSREDIAFTRSLAHAASIVGVPLLDHVVVARGGFTSMLDLVGDDPVFPPSPADPRSSSG